MRVLGIDPGIVGGACIYAPSLRPANRWHVIDLPTIDGTSRKRIDALALMRWIETLSPDHAFIEAAGTMPKNGVVQSFRYGCAVGALEAVVACLDIPVSYIGPQRWKNFHGLEGSDKEQSRARALKLAPELSDALARKGDHGRAEAALIAIYGEHCLRPI